MTEEDEKKLVDYVAIKGEVFYLQAAQDLGIPRAKIKTVAKTLESRGTVKLKYDPAVGTKLVYIKPAEKLGSDAPEEAPAKPEKPAKKGKAVKGPAAKPEAPAEAKPLTKEEKEILIKTTVDNFVEYIYLKGEVSLPNAANYIGVSQTQAEEWAKILEEHDILGIKYSPIHGMLLIAKPISEDEMKEKLRDFESRKSNLDMLALKLEEAIQKYEKTVPLIEREFSIIEEQLTEKLREAEEAVKKLEEIEKEKNRFLKGIRDIHAEEENILKMKASILSVSEQSEDAFMKSKESIADIQQRLKGSHDKLFSYEQELKELERGAHELDGKITGLKYEIAALEKRSRATASGKRLGDLAEFLTEKEQQHAEILERTAAVGERAGGIRGRFSSLIAGKHKSKLEKIDERAQRKLEGIREFPRK